MLSKTFCLLLMSTLFSVAQAESSKNMIKTCREHYLKIINTDKKLTGLRGGEQVQLYIHPKLFVEKYHLDLQNDKLYQSCVK